MNPESGLYMGHVIHRRRQPINHAFRFGLFMMYLDLAELPELFDKYLLWSARRPSLAWFRRSDYLGNPKMELDETVRTQVEQATGQRPDGPIRLLTHLRYGGYIFNPMSMYYCFDQTGTRVQSMVVDVSNTPWGERRAYVLSVQATHDNADLHAQFGKTLHVSPFMTMDLTYQLSASIPNTQLWLKISAVRKNKDIFDATLTMTRRPITSTNLNLALLRYPFITARVVAAIYWHALRLWTKKVPFVPHPSGTSAESESKHDSRH
ncbi:MAG: chromosome partitioning protein ParA [Chloroflexi bacterium]|nr:chromosome partitioning protein ParA [Chloroflexota bacterium]HCU72386.1 DUF1365 domain-containing protein [Chloroflexota bacterium]|tara:strand:- start:4769 stop:5560 length:792 start_codon:yes stop_codon:yes gene_type:complete